MFHDTLRVPNVCAVVIAVIRRRRAFVVASLAALAAAAATPVMAADLTVSAAASLTNAFREVGAAFEVAHPGTHVHFNFAASGALLQQIAKGAPVDVFASADVETMDDAERQGLVDSATRVDFVRNALVVIVPSDSRLAFTSIQGLATDRIARIAIGQPASVPVGRYAKSALAEAGLWTTIEPKTIAAQSVRQALDYVARGEVDAGFVYATDAAAMPGRVRVLFTVPTTRPIEYPIAVLNAAADPATAGAFVRFVASPAARPSLVRHGFRVP